jgi:hypothetical protein
MDGCDPAPARDCDSVLALPAAPVLPEELARPPLPPLAADGLATALVVLEPGAPALFTDVSLAEESAACFEQPALTIKVEHKAKHNHS